MRNDNSTILWQSFDYPSHAFLPGMKIGYDKRAGKTWSLTSWKSTEDPSPRVFSVEQGPNGTSQIFILQGPTRFWTSGIWDGRTFSLAPEMLEDYIFNYSYYSSKDESYWSYSLYDSSIISRLVLDVSGQIKQRKWLDSSHQWNLFWARPRTKCEVYASCGPFGICHESAVDGFCECLPGFEPVSPNNWNSDEGCVRKADLQCGNTTHANGERDQFRQVSDVILPDYPLTLPARSAKECKSACLNNCSCSAYAYDRETCTVWSGDLLNLRKPSDYTSNGQDFYLKLAAPEPNGRGNKFKEWS